MTHVNVAAAPYAGRRVAPLLIGALLAIALTACETASLQEGGAGTAQLAPAQQPAASKVAFAPVIGAPAKISSKMNELLAFSAKEKNIPVAEAKDADFTVKGYLVAAAGGKGTKLSYIWDVTDKSGKRVRRIQGEELVSERKSGDPWSAVDDAAVQKVAAKTSAELANWLPKPGGEAPVNGKQPVGGGTQSAAIQPASVQTTSSTKPGGPAAAETPRAPAKAAPADAPKPEAAVKPSAPKSVAAKADAVVAFVQPITGAPGDGETALMEAMKKHLTSQGVRLTDSKTASTYLVRGSVQLGEAADGQQPITIRWAVIDPSGKPLDNAVVQRNKVPEGSLNGSWGQVADLAAGEAAKAVAKLLPKPAGAS